MSADSIRDLIANRLELGLRESASYSPDEVLLRHAYQALGVGTAAPAAVVPGDASPASPGTVPVIDREALADVVARQMHARGLDDLRESELGRSRSTFCFQTADAVLASGFFEDRAVVVAAEREACAQTGKRALEPFLPIAALKVESAIRSRTDDDPLAAVKREAAAQAVAEFANEHLLHGGEVWRIAHETVGEYRSGVRP